MLEWKKCYPLQGTWKLPNQEWKVYLLLGSGYLHKKKKKKNIYDKALQDWLKYFINVEQVQSFGTK